MARAYGQISDLVRNGRILLSNLIPLKRYSGSNSKTKAQIPANRGCNNTPLIKRNPSFVTKKAKVGFCRVNSAFLYQLKSFEFQN